MAKISIIIPCFNAEKYIDKCVEALEKQEYKDFEVLFVDDASSDCTVKKINNIIQQGKIKAKLIQNEVNSGPAHSRNKGILAANSEFVTFCDSDDWYETNFLSSMVDAIEKNNADIAFCGYSVVDEFGKKEHRPLNYEGKIEGVKAALSLNVDSLCMMIVRTPLMKDTLLPDIRNGEDMAVIPLLIAKTSRCAIISDCLYDYFRRSHSASQNPTMKVVDSFINSFEHLKSNFPSGYDAELEYLGIRNLLYAGLISLYSFTNDKEKAKYILNSFECDFPNWYRNTYIEVLPKYKKMVLFFISRRWYFGIRILGSVRKILTGMK